MKNYGSATRAKESNLTDAAVSASLDAGPLVKFNEINDRANVLQTRHGHRRRKTSDNMSAQYASVDEEFARLKRHLHKQEVLD